MQVQERVNDATMIATVAIAKAKASASKKRRVPAAAMVASALLFLAGHAHAELPAAVATAITGYQTDTLQAIGLVIAAGVAVWALLRLATKLGWR